MKNKLLLLLMVVLLVTGCSNKKEQAMVEKNNLHKTEKVFDYVLDAGTYKKIDYEAEKSFNKKLYDNWGGCTAVARNIDNNTIIGRNMDLTVSNKSAYIFKTDIEGKYKTINLAYTFRDYAPDYKDAIKGLDDYFYNILPFISDDVLNEKGLYIEVNMRTGEGDKFSCSGTNPDSPEKVYMFSLPIFIALNASNIDEALEYVKTLNIYSKNGYWNYAFLLADSTGRFGILEIAKNKFYWNEGENVQTNFYINPELKEINELKAGVGRYDYVRETVEKVTNKEEMYNLMNDVRYSQTYSESPKFDVRSEFVGEKDNWTYDYLMDEKNQPEINEYINSIREFAKTATREQKIELGAWESTFTEIVDINDKSINVRFYEDENRKYTLNFND